MHEPIESKALHYLYFSDEATAITVAKEIAQCGLESERRLSAEGTQWLVLVQHKWPVAQVEFDGIVETLKHSANAHLGEYDGWEIPSG